MRQYLNLLQRVIDDGVERGDRTGTGTRSVFGHQMRFDLAQGFPMLTTKKLHLKSIIHELLWFLSGDTNISYLNENGSLFGTNGPMRTAIWGPSMAASGAVGKLRMPPYRPDFAIVAQLTSNPESRRHIVQPGTLPMLTIWHCRHAIACSSFMWPMARCHVSFTSVRRIFSGRPFNIASYALLTLMLAQVCDLKAGDFVHTLGDAHLYLNHLDQARLQLARTPVPCQFTDKPRQKRYFQFRF